MIHLAVILIGGLVHVILATITKFIVRQHLR